MEDYLITATNLGMTLEHFSTISAFAGVVFGGIVSSVILKTLD